MAGSPAPQGAEMNQLRQEAIHRAREMQARARIPHNAPPPPEPPEEAPVPAPAPRPAPPPQCPPAPPHREHSEADTLDFLTKDPERTLILLLLLILMEEKSDNSLLFALMYLLT